MLNFIKKQRNKQSIHTIKRVITEVIIICGIFVLIGLINKNFLIFSNEVHFTYTYPENELVLSPITPLNDISSITESGSIQYLVNKQTLTDVESEFALKLPGQMKNNFSKARIIITFNPNDSSEALIGPKNIRTGNFDYLPIYNQWLQELDWPMIEQQEQKLYQRNGLHKDFDSFLQSPPTVIGEVDTSTDIQSTTFKATATQYYSNFDQSYVVNEQLKNRYPDAATSTPSIEGNFTAYTYVKTKSDLEINIEKIDNNYYTGADVLDIVVSNPLGEVLHQIAIQDDGNISGKSKDGELQTKTLTIKGAEGLYKITLTGSDSYNRIITNQPFLVIEGTLMLLDNIHNTEADPYTIYTDAHNISVISWHIPATNQTLIVDGTAEYALDSSRSDVQSIPIILGAPENRVHAITLGKNHIGIQGNDSPVKRYFAFSKDSFFNPTPITFKQFDPFSDLENDSPVDFILTNYKPVQMHGDTATATVEIDLNGTPYFKNDVIEFILKIPDLTKGNRNFELHSIEIVLIK